MERRSPREEVKSLHRNAIIGEAGAGLITAMGSAGTVISIFEHHPAAFTLTEAFATTVAMGITTLFDNRRREMRQRRAIYFPNEQRGIWKRRKSS